MAFIKPSLLHSVPGKSTDSAVEIIKKRNDISEFMISDKEAGLINRLDFETSGILIFAKTQQDFNELKLLTKNDKIQKQYFFVSKNNLIKETICNLEIGSRSRTSNKVTARTHSRKKDRTQNATTKFFPIYNDAKTNFSYIGATITQGRRHQIRVHAKSLNIALLNDKIYSDDLKPEIGTHFILCNYKVDFKDESKFKSLSLTQSQIQSLLSFVPNNEFFIRLLKSR
jgi:23S rRNA-/tRNA-specific pseudouridylate synthase